MENGAKEDVSKANNEGLTPMHIASQNGHLSICKWLILNGGFRDSSDNMNDYSELLKYGVVLKDWELRLGNIALLKYCVENM